MLSQRRRHSRWRMYVVLLIFVELIRHGESAPGIRESSSSTPAVRKKSQDIGSLSDFTWQAWLLVDTQAGSQPGMDSATLLRRITPKSVFIAPALPACADGYRADNMNRCVKSVNIDENAHFSFLLQRLNALYANQDNPQAAASKNEQKKSTGPLQLNIPLIANSKPQSTKVEMAETSMNDAIAVLPDESRELDDKMTKSREKIVTMYEMKNDTRSDDETKKEEEEEETTSFQNYSSNVDKTDPKSDAAVVEFVEEMNNTNFSGVVDYNIPIDLKTLLNVSGVKRLNLSDIGEVDGGPTTDKLEDSTEMTPKVVLLLSPTKVPGAMLNTEADPELPSAQNGIIGHAILQLADLASNATTTKEINSVNVSDYRDSPPTWKLLQDPLIAADEHRENETTRAEDDVSVPENSKLKNPHETEFVYDEEDEEDEEYSYIRDLPDEDSTEMEGEEILKHGEAGWTIPTRTVAGLSRRRPQLQQSQRKPEQQQQENRTTDQKQSPDTTRDQIVIRFNDSTSADKDEAGSNVSSEVSIDGDLILETTLLDVNTERLQVTTKSPFAPTREIDATSSDSSDSAGSFGKEQNAAPEIVFSPQDTRDTTSATGLPQGREQAEVERANPTRTEPGEKNDENDEEEDAAPSSSSESLLLYDPPEEDMITEARVIDDDQSDVTESMPMGSLSDSDDALRSLEPADAPASSFERTSASLDPIADYVRFPADDYARQPSQSYVRFPGNEANSIHDQSHKRHYPADDGASYGSTSTKSSVPVRQKSTYHLTMPGWKTTDRAEQSDRTPSTIAVVNRQKQRSLRYWNKMPLVRDPDIYSVDLFANESAAQVQPRDRSYRKSSSSYAETSPRSTDRTQIRKRRRALFRG